MKASNEELALINKLSVKELSANDVFVYPIKLCDNKVDRDNEKMSDTFLDSVARIVNTVGLTGICDHSWELSNQKFRVFVAEVVTNENIKTEDGSSYKYVNGKLYCLSNDYDFVDKIEAGLISECSISFKPTGRVCSICEASDCEHKPGEEYDGKKCYHILEDVDDLYEVSLVAVPCQRGVGINKKSLGRKGGTLMKRSVFKLLAKSKSMQASDVDEVIKAVNDDEDVSEEDVKQLIDENVALKAQIEELNAEVTELKGCISEADKKSVVLKAIEATHPINEKIAECMYKELDTSDLKKGEDGKYVGLDEKIEVLKKSFAGCFVITPGSDVEKKSFEKPTVVEKVKPASTDIKYGLSDTVAKKSVKPADSLQWGLN